MPSFFQSGRFCGVSYTTGPAHVRLQISFGEQAMQEPELVQLQASGCCGHHLLDPQRIRLAVVDAAKEANRQLGTTFFPSAVRYVPDDSPRYELFGYCTTLLVRRLASGGAFEVVSGAV